MSVRGFEPRTTWLKVKCSTTWATRPYLIISFARKMPRTGIEPVTRGFSVLCSTDWAIWANAHFPVRVAGAGFEPTTFGLWARRASRLLHPALLNYWAYAQADDRTRTDNLLITNQLLCQLSHIGECLSANGWRWIRTTEAICSRFTVCPLWPLGNPSIFFF